ncbi:MAG TPA: IclR family transcriptional regulator [Blastocatellia bacterium]|nr:IclR family transcriptional regulator [Blastocatellia bacterium]
MGGRVESSSTAVERALAILEAIGERSSGMTNSEISRWLSIPKSTASYILRTLEQRGYLQRERGTGRYRLGLKVLALSRGVDSGTDIKRVALPVLERLVERSNLTAHLAVLDRGEAVYIEKVDSPGFIKMDTWVGKRMEIHSTGVGKVLVAGLPQAEIEAIVKARGLRKLTPKTITSPAKFLREIEKVRDRGYSIDDEENSLGARCVAAPVMDAAGRVIAAVGVSGTVNQIDRASIARVAEMARDAARRISKQFGYPAPARKPRSN